MNPKKKTPGERPIELILDHPTGPQHLGVGEGCVGERRVLKVFIQSKKISNSCNLRGRKTNFRGRRDGPGCRLCGWQMVKRSLWNRNVITFNCCPIWWLPSFTSHLKDHLLVCLWWKAGWENSTILAKKLFYIFIGSWCLVFCTWSDMSYLACAGTASPHQVQAGELEENPKPHHFDHKCVSLKEYKSPFLKV